MTDYLKLAKETAPEPAGGENPYLQLVQDDEKQRQQRARAVIETALRGDPEAAAEHQRLSSTSGLPLRVIERNLDEVRVREQARAIDLVRMAQESPVLARQLTDPSFTNIAVDDVGTLQSIEKAVGAGVRYVMGASPGGGLVGRLQTFVPRAVGAWAGVKQAGVDVFEPWARLAAGEDNWFSRMSAYYAGQVATAEAELAELSSRNDSLIGRGVDAGVDSFLQQAKYLPLALTGPVGAGAALTGMSAETFGSSYGKAAQRNLPLWQALGYASADAMVEFWTEKLPLDALVGDISAAAPVAKVLLRQIAREVPGEQAATVLQDLNEWATLNPGKPFVDYLAERPEAAVETFIATIVGVGGNVALTHQLARTADALVGADWRGYAAQSYSEQLQEALKAAAGSTLRERSPATFQQFVQAVADAQGQEARAVYVDAEVLAQMPAAVLEQLPEDVRRSVAEEAEVGGVVALPVAAALAVAPGTPLEQALVEHGRVAPDAPSLAETKAQGEQAQAWLDSQLEDVMRQAQDKDALEVSRQVIQARVAQQIVASGRFSPAVADAYGALTATFFTVQAERLRRSGKGKWAGLTPEQLYDRWNLRTSGTAGQGQVFNDAGPQADARGRLDNVEAYHFSMADRPVITTAAYGTNYAGSGRELYLTAQDERLRKRAYFYVDKGTGINPEAGVGGRGHRAYLNNVYDADVDPLGLKKGANQLAFETAVLDAGFSGYLSRLEGTQSGQVIMLGDQTIQAELLGPTAKIASGQRVPALPAREPQWQVQASGTPEQLQLRLARMQASPSWAPYDIRIEGDKLMVRPKTPGVLAQRAEGDTRYRTLAIERLATIRPPKRSAVAIMQGAEKTPVFRNLFELSRWFTQKNRRGAEDMDDPAVRRRMLDALYADTLMALTDAGSAVGWYDAKVKAALDIVAQLHPEIATNDEARFGFITVLAITSNQTRVNENFELANAIYSKWKETGELPVDVGAVMDTRAKTEMSKSLAKMRELIATHGWARMREFMTSKLPAGEIEAFTGYPVTGESKGSLVYGAVFLGPKIGAFFNNLYGNFDTVTMDRWFMRTINRIRGSMLELPASFDRSLETLAAQFEANPDLGLQFGGVTREQVLGDLATYRQLDDQARGDILQVLGALPNIERYVKERHKLFARGRFVGGKHRSYVDRTPENMLAKNIDLAIHGDQQTPRGGADRELMRELVFKLQQRLKADGIDMVVADIQAALWYYEKDLVAKLKGETSQGEMFAEAQEAEDYETAARRLLAPGRNEPGRGAAGRAGPARPASRRDDGGEPAPVTGDLFAQRDGGGVDGDGAGSAALGDLAPLAGAPRIEGATGPDPRLVAVAEQYARDNGIVLRRQAEYVEVDPERAARIAAAYDAMPHAPQDPQVAAAYAELIRQTVAQYRALEAAGYRFYFFDEANDPYQGNPWNAMRDLRANQTMAVFATESGFGSGATELDVSNNPLLADTGITWPYGSPDGEPKRVLANDLFRAVHDAFGHGLEGAGFRAQGEENAWQAHVRLFTGLAVGAITTETRGQNSWLNYGPYGEQNRKAKVEDTVFADQKTGLLPEWAWTEGRADDAGELEQGEARQALGTFSPSRMEIVLNKGANLSTFLHELGHFFLEAQADLAADPDAPDDIKQDMDRVLAWFGVESLDAWRALTFEQKVPYHEKWAESMERYMLEGRAPSQELQPIMRKFRAWMLSVYKSLKQMLERRPDAGALNDDIRRVFDRMLAMQDQVAATEEALALPPDPDATAAAEERLAARSLRDLKWSVKARDKFIKRLQNEAKATRERVRNEVQAQVDELPVVKAKLHLDALSKNPDREAALAIRRAAREEVEPLVRRQVIADMLGDQEIKGLAKGQWIARHRREIDLEIGKRMLEWDKANPVPPPLQNVTDADLAIVADSFGYPNPEAMLQAIQEFGDKQEVIDAITERRMLEEHGDLIDERAIEEAASQAVHNEARARSLATELKAQSELTGARRDTGEKTASGAAKTVSVLVEAAKQFGERIAAVTLVRDLKDATWRHTAAEQRAGRRWYAATAEGRTADAAKAKQDQVLNNGAVRALQQAREDVLAARDFFKRVLQGNDEKVVEKGRDPDLVNAARAVLRAYGFETATTKAATAYLETLAERDPATHAVVQGYIDAANAAAQPADALTVAQLRELHDTIRAIWNLAKETRSMEVKGDRLDIDDAADELSDKLSAHPIPVAMPGESRALTKADERKSWLQYAGAMLRRVEAWAELLDGQHGGPFQRLVFQPIKDAADRYRADRTAYRRELVKLLENIAPTFSGKPIEAQELGYTFGMGHNGVGHAELLHALLHTGNPSNKRKLLLGRGWATLNDDGTIDTARWDAFIERMHNTGVLTKAHWDFVQSVWDLLERTKPLAQETHRKVFGRYFAEVTAESFETPFGAYRGGYVPAQADPRLVPDAGLRALAEAENKSMAFSFPATNRGFTQSRVEYNRPLVLDLRTLGQHLDKVLLFSHMEAPVRAARRLLTHKRVSSPLAKLQPAAYSGMLLPWLNRSAQQIVEDPVVGDGGVSRVLPLLRARAGMALMMANVSNTLQQITGFSSALVRVKPAHLMRAAAQYIAHPRQFKEAVHGASKAMAERMDHEVSALTTIMDDILVNPSRYESMQRWAMQHSHFLQAAVDNVMSPIVWTGAYNQALAEGRSEEDARDFADSTVRQTQGSSLPEDVSRFETGSAFVRLFTQFMGYFNMVANTNATAVRQVIDRVGVKKGALPASYLILVGLLAPIWIAEAIAQAMRGGPDDEDDDGYLDDWLAAVFGFGTLKGALAMVPGAAQVGQLVVNRFNDNPADDRMSLSPAISLVESATAAPFSVAKAIEGGDQRKAVRDVAALVSMATGLPAYPLARPLGYAAGVASGRIDPTGPVDAARGAISGTPSPASKD